MDHHVDLVGPHAEKPPRLDDLEPLVHHRRRVDRDPAAHLPVRMREGLLRGNVGHAGQWRAEERPDAGSTSRRASRCSPPRRHWCTALCSLSTGSSSRPAFFAAAMTNSPAATSTSLFERAMIFPSLTASYVASSPTTPTAAETTMSAAACVPTASIPSRP